MALRSELQFWTGPTGTPSNTWKTALNLTFNAMTSFEIEENLSNPKVATIRLNNAADEPFGTESDKQVGPFSVGQTDALNEFQRVRIFHPDTGNILFYGKIYRLENVYTPTYGEMLKITAYDNLKEVVDYPTDDKDTPFVLQGKTRSAVLKEILNDTSTPRHESTLAIPLTNIDSNPDATIFETSAKTVRNAAGEGNIFLNTGRKKALGVMLGISQLDPHTDTVDEDDFGYDFHLSDRFNLATSSGNHIPAQDFNYFKRGTRPAVLESTVGAYKGMHLHYPAAQGAFVETGTHRFMLQEYAFERDSEEIYTEGLINTSEVVQSDVVDDTSYREVRTHLRVELLEVSGFVGGTPTAGKFQWEGLALDAREKRNLSVERVAEEIAFRHGPNVDHDGFTGIHDHVIGRVQWQDAYSGTTSAPARILVSYQIGSAHFENMDKWITGSSSLLLASQQSGITCNIVPSTGRLSQKYSIRRAYRVKRDTQSGGDGLRRDVFNALTKAKVQTIRGNLRMLNIPTTYVDITGYSVTSAQQITFNSPFNPAHYGFKLGMTIAKVNSGGDVTDYGYASAITNNEVRADLKTSSNGWTGYSGTIRLYIPIRAGHYLYATNQMQHIAGYQFINSVIYSEGEGTAASNFKTQATQTVSPYGVSGSGLKPGAVSSFVVETVAPIGASTDSIMKAGLPWTFIPNHATDRGIESTDYNTITIRAGVFSIANGLYTHNILAHTRDITTVDHIIYFAPDVSTTVFQFTLRADYVPDNDHIILGWCRAVADTNGKAIISFLGNVIGSDPMFDGGYIAPSTINTAQLANNSITAAILKASSRPWTSNIRFTGTAFDALKWDNGTNSQSATLTFANDETVTITAGTATSLTANTTYYAYIDGVTGTQAMETLSSTYTDAIGDAKILLAIVTVGADADDGATPAIFPFNSKVPTINAVVIAADAIQTDHLQADAVTATKIETGSLNSHVITLIGDGKLKSRPGVASGTGSSQQGVLISPAGIAGYNSAGNRVFHLDPVDGIAKFGTNADELATVATSGTLVVSNVIIYSAGTATQSSQTVTGTNTVWLDGLVGTVFTFTSGGGGGIIASVNTGAQTMVVSNSATVSSGTYTIRGLSAVATGGQLANNLVTGLQSGALATTANIQAGTTWENVTGSGTGATRNTLITTNQTNIGSIFQDKFDTADYLAIGDIDDISLIDPRLLGAGAVSATTVLAGQMAVGGYAAVTTGTVDSVSGVDNGEAICKLAAQLATTTAATQQVAVEDAEEDLGFVPTGSYLELGTGSTREIMRVVKGIATASGTITVKRGQAGTPTYGYTRANQTVCYDPKTDC